MASLKLVFILRDSILYLVLRNHTAEFDLTKYGFDVKKGISSGPNGNHLFKKTGPIKHMRAAIKSKLSKGEKWMYTLSLLKVTGIFISDRPLNNLGIKHFCDFLEQGNCNQITVYYDPVLSRSNPDSYINHLTEYIPDEKIIGTAGPEAFSYWYKTPDDSIAQDGLLSGVKPQANKK